jgi:PAS domain S-box-containing protein
VRGREPIVPDDAPSHSSGGALTENQARALADPVRTSADRLEDRLEFETLISDTSASLFAAPPEQIDVAVERALVRVRAFFGADRCALLSVSADQQVVNVRLASYSEGIAAVPADVNLAEVFPWSRRTLLVERRPVRVSRLADLPPEAEIEREAWIRMPIRSALTLPIESGGAVGHLILLNTVHQEREWPDAFVTRLRVLGELLAGAFERKKALDGLRETEARLASGADLAGLAFYEVDFDKGVMYSDNRLRDLCGIPPDRTQGLQALHFWMDHLHPDDRQRILDLRQELHDGRIARLSVEYRYLHPDRGEQWIQHLARVTIHDDGGRVVRTFGVLRDITKRKRTEDELRDLSQRLIQAHEEERALLARELHDDLTQRLAVLAIDVGRAEIAAPAGVQAETMRAVREGLVRLSEDIHSLAYQLHPSVLEELGLEEALRTECERVGRQGRVELAVDLQPLPPAIGKDAAFCLFRVAQEALNNVFRHAGARAASVVLRPMDGGLLLAVRDDGVGFDPGSPRQGRSLGLASMRERLRLANGTLDIESAPGQGTAIVAWVPAEGERA